MKRPIVCATLLGVGLLVPPAWAQNEDQKAAKEALKALHEFIGGWKGSGGPANKPRPQPRELWTETVNWGWKFKGADAWLTLEIEQGRHWKTGELRYLPKTKKYQLTLTDLKGKKAIFEGEFKDNYLTLEREDPDTREGQKIIMNTAAEGVRFIYRFERKPEGRTLFLKEYMVACTRIGESLGKREKQNECVVSGGLGTMAVSYKGETFYVCCSGCRDEFNANPEKYVREFKAKQGKK